MKSTKELRNFLTSNMEALADGEIELDDAKGICNFAQQIHNTLSIELRGAAAKAKYGKDFKLESVNFGE